MHQSYHCKLMSHAHGLLRCIPAGQTLGNKDSIALTATIQHCQAVLPLLGNTAKIALLVAIIQQCQATNSRVNPLVVHLIDIGLAPGARRSCRDLSTEGPHEIGNDASPLLSTCFASCNDQHQVL